MTKKKINTFLESCPFESRVIPIIIVLKYVLQIFLDSVNLKHP